MCKRDTNIKFLGQCIQSIDRSFVRSFILSFVRSFVSSFKSNRIPSESFVNDFRPLLLFVETFGFSSSSFFSFRLSVILDSYFWYFSNGLLFNIANKLFNNPTQSTELSTKSFALRVLKFNWIIGGLVMVFCVLNSLFLIIFFFLCFSIDSQISNASFAKHTHTYSWAKFSTFAERNTN